MLGRLGLVSAVSILCLQACNDGEFDPNRAGAGNVLLNRIATLNMYKTLEDNSFPDRPSVGSREDYEEYLELITIVEERIGKPFTFECDIGSGTEFTRNERLRCYPKNYDWFVSVLEPRLERVQIDVYAVESDADRLYDDDRITVSGTLADIEYTDLVENWAFYERGGTSAAEYVFGANVIVRNATITLDD